MASQAVQIYCGVIQDDAAFGEPSSTDLITSVEANWNRSAQLWDDGVNKWIFWGDVTGDLTMYGLDLEEGSCDATTPSPAVADYSTAVAVALYQGAVGGTRIKIVHLGGLYDFQLVNKRTKTIGDKMVFEDGTNYKIFRAVQDIS